MSPVRTAIISWRAKVPFYVLCAFLMQESSGGHNIYGRDPTIFKDHGKVTKANYADYVALRDQTDPPQCQGVGPMQLTWKPFQDRADTAGGCWRAGVNTLTGARILAEIRAATNSWAQVAHNYKGEPGADVYVAQMKERFIFWRGVMAAA